jgi:hypothetical protein
LLTVQAESSNLSTHLPTGFDLDWIRWKRLCRATSVACLSRSKVSSALTKGIRPYALCQFRLVSAAAAAAAAAGRRARRRIPHLDVSATFPVGARATVRSRPPIKVAPAYYVRLVRVGARARPRCAFALESHKQSLRKGLEITSACELRVHLTSGLTLVPGGPS